MHSLAQSGNVLARMTDIRKGLWNRNRSHHCAIPALLGETNRHLATRIREHLTSERNSHISQHINGSDTCKALCSEDCFSILDTASMSFQGGFAHWVGKTLVKQKQVNHVNLSLLFN